MAEGDEKTQDPTEKRKQKAIEDGQVPQSKDLSMFVSMFLGSLALIFLGGWMGRMFINMLKQGLTIDRDSIFDKQLMAAKFWFFLSEAIISMLPLMIVLTISTILATILMSGFHVSKKKLMPKISNMNPIKGIKKLFSVNSLVELFKAVIKTFLIAFGAVSYLWILKYKIFSLSDMPIKNAIQIAFEIVGWGFFVLVCTYIIVVIIDVPFQIMQNKKKLKMSVQDIKEEFKQSEGDPQVKGKRRQIQQQIAQSRMMSDVPKADVVITNPTHYAIALCYKEDDEKAPIVVAKGEDYIAFKIKEVAIAHDVVVMQSPMLARSIFYTTEIDQEVPEGLYLAIAQVLAYVYQLKLYKSRRASKPQKPDKFDIPLDLRY